MKQKSFEHHLNKVMVHLQMMAHAAECTASDMTTTAERGKVCNTPVATIGGVNVSHVRVGDLNNPIFQAAAKCMQDYTTTPEAVAEYMARCKQDYATAPEVVECEPPTEAANRAGHYLYTATTLSKRGTDWLAFADEVAHHIENYTVPQYGDAPNDQVESWTAEHCINQLHKYASRHGSNKRKDQDHLDLLKIAHYAQLAAFKLRAEQAAAEPTADSEAAKRTNKKYVGSTEALYALDVGKRVAMKGWSEHRYLQKHGDFVYEYQTNTPHGLRVEPYSIEPRTLRDAEWYILEM